MKTIRQNLSRAILPGVLLVVAIVAGAPGVRTACAQPSISDQVITGNETGPGGVERYTGPKYQAPVLQRTFRFDAEFEPENSGVVWKGGPVGRQIVVGDDASNRDVRAFISFKIFGLPTGPDGIVSAELQPGCTTKQGAPFVDLGDLEVTEGVQYGALTPDAFDGTGLTSTYHRFCPPRLDVTKSLKNLLSASAGPWRQYQVRLRFSKATDDDGSPDDILLQSPRMTVQYVPVPPPEILSLTGPKTIRPGETVHLSWQTRNATNVFLNGSGVAPSGSQSFAIHPQTGSSSYTYTLRAQGRPGAPEAEVSRSLEVQVAKWETGSMPLNVDLGGTVTSRGAVLKGKYEVGDDMNNVDYRSFLSFDLKGATKGAKVQWAYLDLGHCAVVNSTDDSWNAESMGSFNVEWVSLATLDASAYGRTGQVIGSDQYGCTVSLDVTNAVQKALDNGYQRFQVRMYLTKSSNGDGVGERLRMSPANLGLRVQYR